MTPRRSAMAAVVAVIVLVAAWWLWRPEAVAPVVAAAAVAASSGEPPPPVRHPVPPPPVVDRVPVPDNAPADDTACRHEAPKPVGGTATAADDDDAVQERFVQRLLRASDPKARALAVFLTPQSDDALRAERTDALAQDAIHANDPQLYAMAMSACQRSSTDETNSACQLLNLPQWSQIDPGNGVPWIRLAADARRRADPGAETDAMYHASVAERYDTDLGSFAALADQALPPTTPASERVQLMTAAAGIQSAMTIPEGREPFVFCRQARQDPNRRQLCEALASGFVDHGASMQDRSAGARLGTGLGWDADRLSKLAQDTISLSGIAPDLPHGTPVDCTALADARQYHADVAAQGEVAALRKVLARTGKRAGP